MKAVILDANAVHRLFNGDEVGKEIWTRILGREIQCPFGGSKYRDEVSKSPLSRIFLELVRSGSLKVYSDSEIDFREEKFAGHPAVKSDDPHILAIAERSGCRVLFTNDKALTVDFKNLKVLPSPKGKVIAGKFFEHVITNAPHCQP